jgi:hypothetical protein
MLSLLRGRLLLFRIYLEEGDWLAEAGTEKFSGEAMVWHLRFQMLVANC